MTWNREPRSFVGAGAKANAPRLRRRPTDAEKIFWKHLRDLFAGQATHFRRQVAIGDYVADFCCHKHRLIVELDGPIHTSLEAKARDASRTKYLRSQGYRVLRFRNEQVVTQRAQVLDAISAAIAMTTPTPGPSPQGGGEQVGA